MCCVEGMDEIGWEGGGLFEGVDGGVTGLVADGDCLEEGLDVTDFVVSVGLDDGEA